MISYVDLETLYIDEIKNGFDLKAIKECGKKWGYDAMYGAGQNVMKSIFPELPIALDYNPSFRGQAPEPIHKNLKEFSALIEASKISTVDWDLTEMPIE
jgi:phosphomannomutase